MNRKLLPSRLSGSLWGTTFLATVVLTWFFHTDATSFRGVAEAAETNVSSEAPVEILALDLVPGQEVSIGDTLVRLRHPELTMRMAEIRHEIEGASGDANMNSAENRRRVAQMRADFESRKSVLLGQIRSLEDEASRNRTLLSGFGIAGRTASDSDGEGLKQRIQEIRRQIDVEQTGTASQIALLEGSKGDMVRLAQAQQDALREELSLLEEEDARLVIRSRMAGVVGSVNFRPGEKVSPFSPILSISGHSPTLVRGYLHERMRSEIRLGDSVDVGTIGARAASIGGRVVGLGSRIVEFPIRLRKIPQIPQWGREVVVRIPEENSLLLGEMVVVGIRGSILGVDR